MRTILISTLFILTVVAGRANEKLYNKLNRLYLTDRNKCMEQSKKVMKKKSQESIPYYFASVIYYDKSKESQNLRGTYLQLYRAVSSASKFEQYSGEQERNMVHWDEHIVSIKVRSEKLIKALNKNEMEDLSQTLTENLLKVESLASYFEVEKENKDVLDKTIYAKVPETSTTAGFEKVDGHFYGLPNGNERIASADQAKELEILKLINEERIRRHIPALVWNEDLANASRYHAYDQGTQGYFSHASNDKINNELIVVGSTFDRLRKFYKGSPSGECIAAGNLSAEKTVEQWLKSDGHAKILLDPSIRHAGIGFVQVEDSPYQYYWVLATGN